MTDKTETPADWVLTEAAKRCGWEYGLAILRNMYRHSEAFRALCDALTAPPLEAPVDRKRLCAREAYREHFDGDMPPYEADAYVRAIELWESGYGA